MNDTGFGGLLSLFPCLRNRHGNSMLQWSGGSMCAREQTKLKGRFAYLVHSRRRRPEVSKKLIDQQVSTPIEEDQKSLRNLWIKRRRDFWVWKIRSPEAYWDFWVNSMLQRSSGSMYAREQIGYRVCKRADRLGRFTYRVHSRTRRRVGTFG